MKQLRHWRIYTLLIALFSLVVLYSSGDLTLSIKPYIQAGAVILLVLSLGVHSVVDKRIEHNDFDRNK